jgi:hypothetical protein
MLAGKTTVDGIGTLEFTTNDAEMGTVLVARPSAVTLLMI